MHACVLRSSGPDLQDKTGITLPFFDEKGGQALERHELNRRQVKAVENRFTKSVLQHGNVPGVRGAPWATGTWGSPPYKLITYGTLSRAVYRAVAADPDNKVVQLSVARGLVGADLYRPDTPPDVVRWLKRYHNEFHDGSSYTFCESFEDRVGWGSRLCGIPTTSTERAVKFDVSACPI